MSEYPRYPAFPPAADVPAPVGGPAAPPRRRPLGLILAVVALVVALAAAATVAVVQSERLADQRVAAAVMQEQVADGEAEVARLEEELAAAEAAGNPLEDLLGGGGLEDLFGDVPGAGGTDGEDPLGGGEGGLEDLFGGEGGLDDLLGGEGGGLEDLFGGAAAGPDVNACITGLEDLPDVSGDTLETQFAAVTEVVEQLRERDFPEPIEPQVMTGEEIRDFFDTEIREAYPAEVADAERRTFGLLEAVPDDIDLIQTQIDLLGDQVAGFYNDETLELVVRADDPDATLGATGLVTLAHELEHALADATVGLPDLDGFETDDDGAQAALAVVEGSAVTLMSQFQVTALDPFAMLGDLGTILESQQGLDGVPHLIRESLTFPYFAGPTYVCSLHAQGGWDAVDAAMQDPPATTHAILFPGSGVDEPVAVPQPAGPEGYDAQDRRTFGAAQLSWLLGAPGGDDSLGAADPVAAVEPWRGGEVSLWTQGEESAVALVLAGAGLCDPVTEWWQAAATGAEEPASGTEQVVRGTTGGTVGVVSCDGEDVRVGIGPTVEVARQAIAG